MKSEHSQTVLDPLCRAVAQAAAAAPPIHRLGPDAARTRFVQQQSRLSELAPVDERWLTVPATVGDVRVRLVRPRNTSGMLPVVVYMHGGGWVLGDASTHDRLVRELAVGARAAVAFVEYCRAPEAVYPVALEQGYAAARWLTGMGHGVDVDGTRMAVAGDSAGGNLAAALTHLARLRGDVRFVHQSLYYPVTDAAAATASRHDFGSGHYLSAETMQWFWDLYTPDPSVRAESTASPNRAGDDQLRGLPPAFIVVAEADPLRDEGEAYAARLRTAGVPVTVIRYGGVIHDFMVLEALHATAATRAAVVQAAAVLRTALWHL